MATAAGVAESTVSRALNDSPLITDAVKRRVREFADKLGYIPNRQAVLLASNKTMRIGLVVRTYESFSPFTRSYFARLLDGVLLQAETLGYSLSVILDKRGGAYKDLSKLIHAKEVDGLVLAVSALDDPRLGALVRKSVPFVLVNNVFPNADTINCDPAKGTWEALSHLHKLGHSRIGYIAGDQNYWDGRERLGAIRTASAGLGVSLVEVDGDFSKRSGASGARVLLNYAAPPSAVVASSDRCALGVIEYCRAHNHAVPGQVSVVGFDDLGPAGNSVPGLTTIHHPVVRMGTKAVEMLSKRLTTSIVHPQVLTVDSELVVRRSTGAPAV